MSDPSSQPGPALHGPGGLLATPGLVAPKRKRTRKWGVRTKAKQIVGNLYRSDTGKFQAGSGGQAAGATPQRGRQLSKQPKPTARPVAKPAKAAPKKAAPKGRAGPKPKDPAVTARQAQRDAERQADRQTRAEDRAQRQADRTARLARQAQRDQERAKKQQDAAGNRAAKQIDAGLSKLAKPTKPAAAAGGSKKPADKPDKTNERARKATETAGQVGMAAQDLDALRNATETGGVQNDALSKLGLVGSDGLATDQGRRALTALERGDMRGYNAALQDAKSRMGREQAARDRKQAVEGRRTQAASNRDAKQRQQIERIKRRAQAGGKLSQSELDQATEAGALGTDGRWKSFTVFKDHAGQPRWIARTTTAYRDRDGEIISEAALDADSLRMTRSKQFGPLRYWHIGRPDPSNLDAPWGPGVDIGTCDYSVVIGRTRIESGTFHSAAIAQKMAAVAHRHEMSPGFLHPIDAPDRSGVFDSIHTFERSPVPIRYGRGSNLFTGFTVKEFRMELSEMERRFKAMYQELGLTPEQGVELGQSLIATEKAAAAQGIAFKEAEAALPDVVINGITYKAFPPKADDVPSDVPVIEASADDPTLAMADDGDGADDEAAETGDYVSDMTVADFETMISALLAPVLKMQDMVKSIGDAHSELKSMYGGAATKEAGVNAEQVALKSQYTDLAAKIAQIEGDQPAVILPDDVAAALKSTGPASPPAPDAVDVPNDPSRPFAQIAARTMPALYKNTPDGGFAGWAPPPSS